jgi:protoheme ferro-lyase
VPAFDAVLFIAFGGPQGPADVRPFLANVLRGRRVAPGRVEEVAHHYGLFGGVSPLTELTLRQAEGLQARLSERGYGLPVRVGMRNWHPFLEDTLAELSRQGARRAIGVIAAAHRSYSGCTQYRENVAAARASLGARGLADVEVCYVGDWHTHPGFIGANAERVRAALMRLPANVRDAARVVFTAHSIPVSMAERYPYQRQIEESARLVIASVGRNLGSADAAELKFGPTDGQAAIVGRNLGSADPAGLKFGPTDGKTAIVGRNLGSADAAELKSGPTDGQAAIVGRNLGSADAAELKSGPTDGQAAIVGRNFSSADAAELKSGPTDGQTAIVGRNFSSADAAELKSGPTDGQAAIVGRNFSSADAAGHAVVFQSRSGRPEDPWLGPDICDYLREEAAKGLRAVVIAPIGFICDHIEVLYDLDVEAAGVCRELGLPMARAQTVNDHPLFVEALADVVIDTYRRYDRARPLQIVAGS